MVYMKSIAHLATVQYCAGKPLILPFMWMPLGTNHPPKDLADQAHPLGTGISDYIGPKAGQCMLPHHENCSGTALGMCQRA